MNASSNYTTQNDLLLNNLMDFYKDEKTLNRMLKIITGESKISLRIVDWFSTNYAKKYIRFLILWMIPEVIEDLRSMLITN